MTVNMIWFRRMYLFCLLRDSPGMGHLLLYLLSTKETRHRHIYIYIYISRFVCIYTYLSLIRSLSLSLYVYMAHHIFLKQRQQVKVGALNTWVQAPRLRTS